MLNIFINKLRDYRNILPMMGIMTGLALALIYVFGQGFEGGYSPVVVLVDQDHTVYSKGLAEELKKLDGFRIEEGNFENAEKLMRDGNAIAVAVICEKVEEKFKDGETGVRLYTSGNSIEHVGLKAGIESTVTFFLMDQSYIGASLNLYQQKGIDLSEDALRDRLKEQEEKYPIVSVETEVIGGGTSVGYNSLQHSFIGYILFFSLYTIVFGIGSIIEEKEAFVWQRQLVAPVSRFKVYTANIGAAFVLGMAQLLLMILAARWLFGIDWGGSMPALVMVLACYVLAATAFGLLLTVHIKSMQQLGAFSPLLLTATSMLGGCMWPLDIIQSKVLLFLADLTPQRWAYQGLKAVIVHNGGVGEVAYPCFILLFMAGIFLLGLSLPAVGKNGTKVLTSD